MDLERGRTISKDSSFGEDIETIIDFIISEILKKNIRYKGLKYNRLKEKIKLFLSKKQIKTIKFILLVFFIFWGRKHFFQLYIVVKQFLISYFD